MKKNITLFVYSHSSYSDVWTPFFYQADKYLKDYKKVLFTDSLNMSLPQEWEHTIYSDSEPYSNRVISCLEKIQTELCFLHHEDMFLYDTPDYELLNKYENIVLNEDIDFIRLLRSVDDPIINYSGSPTLYNVLKYSPYFFSIQPTIFKTEKLLQIFKATANIGVREFENEVQKRCLDLNIKGLFHYNEEQKRGQFHFDSSVYPYIATAIVKGKWNFSEYSSELSNILSETSIDKTIRGTA